MRRQGIVWLGATIAVLGAAACFSDPTSSLRSGASRLQITEVSGAKPLQVIGTLSYLNVVAGDTVVLAVQVKDNQGNYFSITQPTVGTANTGIATLANQADTVKASAPGHPYWKVNLIGVATGATTASFTAGGVTDSVKVNVQ